MKKSKKDLIEYISGLKTSPFFYFIKEDPKIKKIRKEVETEDEIEAEDYQALVTFLQAVTAAND